jgi:hypothetical protein
MLPNACSPVGFSWFITRPTYLTGCEARELFKFNSLKTRLELNYTRNQLELEFNLEFASSKNSRSGYMMKLEYFCLPGVCIHSCYLS